ncbi:hypothetical protein [Clostridium sp. JNZ J1-5]
MKKFAMTILTIVVVIITVVLYRENYKLPSYHEYKKPSINIESNKYGEINNIFWIPASDSILLFYGIKKVDNREMTTLYNLNLKDNSVKKLVSFPTHPVLRDYLKVKDFGRIDAIYSASPYGVNKINMTYDSNMSLIVDSSKKETDGKYYYDKLSDNYITTYPIDNFENANSLDISNYISYCIKDDGLIYNKPINSNFSIKESFSKEQNDNNINFLKFPYKLIGNSRVFESILYLKEKDKKLDLYRLNIGDSNIINKNKSSLLKNEKVIFKDVLYADIFGFGLDTVSGIKNGENSYEIFIDDEIVNSIPKNNDSLGYPPYVKAYAANGYGKSSKSDKWVTNEYRKYIYTSFNEEGKGSIYFSLYEDSEPIEIVKDLPIVGPVILNNLNLDSFNGSYKNRILFFTNEDGKIKVKIGNLLKKSNYIYCEKVEDITHIFI